MKTKQVEIDKTLSFMKEVTKEELQTSLFDKDTIVNCVPYDYPYTVNYKNRRGTILGREISWEYDEDGKRFYPPKTRYFLVK